MPTLIVEYLGYMAMIIGCIVCGDWLQKRLIFRWRTHLTDQFQKNWLEGHKHYRLRLTGEPDNPDQRIAEDIYLLADKSISLFRSFINNIANSVRSLPYCGHSPACRPSTSADTTSPYTATLFGLH